MDDFFDIIIIGTGAGGGTLAHRLAPSGKRILILERGAFLPREKANWDSAEVFEKMRYHNSEKWRDKDGEEFQPGLGYYVGGNTKVYGGAMFRLRERDFERIEHKGGISPEWPLKYRDFERYYGEAEVLYEVHGQRGSDPTEPPASTEYPHPPVSHEPHIQELFDRITAAGGSPFPLPLCVKLNEADRLQSACIRCNTCDGFPCMVDGKADADVNAVRPAMQRPNVTLQLHAKVTRLLTGKNAREISGVEAEVAGEKRVFRASVVVLSAGAVIGKQGWKIIGLLRLSPLIPFNASNYFYGVTKVGFLPYVAASAVGMLPGTLLYVYLGAAGKAGLGGGGKQHSPLEYIFFAIGLLATIGVTIWVSRIAKNALKNPRRAQRAVVRVASA